MMGLRKCRNLYTLVVVLAGFFYINWLLNVTGWSRLEKFEKRVRKLRLRQDSIVFELFEAFDQDKTIQTNGHFMLITAKNLPDYREKFSFDSNINEFLTSNELSAIFKLLYLSKAFLMDVNAIENLVFDDLSQDSVLYQNKIYNASSADFSNEILNGNKHHLLTFGVKSQNFKDLNQALIDNLVPKCNFIQMSGTYSNLDILTSFYIECKRLTIQISIVYERGNFLWIASDDYQVNSDNLKSFGDRPRALNNFDLIQMVDKRSNYFLLPSDIDKFLFEYDHSVFLECNRDLVKKNIQNLGPKHQQDAKKNKMIGPVLEHISKSLESFRKHYWLAGGTLLGWYRDCGIIPFTQDVDIAIWSHEYDDRIKQHFLGNKIVRIWGTLGLLNDSFEFRLFNDKFTFDLFLVYKINQTHQWCGYQVKRYKFRRFLPNFEKVCSAELLNSKYMVPCDPVKYLDKEYGPKLWESPQSKNYTWTNVVFWKNWSDSDWPRSIKYYDKNGNLLKNKILEYVNKFQTKNLTSIPDDQD